MLVCPKCGSTYTREVDHCGVDGARLVQQDDDPLLGRTIDRYRLVRVLGSGGMARVYLAEHAFIGQPIALKVLFGEIASDAALVRRFHREARVLAAIKHPNVVRVSDFGASAEGIVFMAMEYLEGRTLAEILRSEGPLSIRRTASLVRQIALGLGAAHSEGFVHRDLKPGNVLVVADADLEVPKILDFGLVRLLEDERQHTQLTAAGQIFGTPMYMSPEQISGGEVGPRSDLYALGVILYQMLSGAPPFRGDIQQLAHQHVLKAPAPLDPSSEELGDLAMALLAKRPDDRPESAEVVVAVADAVIRETERDGAEGSGGAIAVAGTPRRTSSGRRGLVPGARAAPDSESREELRDDRVSAFMAKEITEPFGPPSGGVSIEKAALGWRARPGSTIAVAALLLISAIIGAVVIASPDRFGLGALGLGQASDDETVSGKGGPGVDSLASDDAKNSKATGMDRRGDGANAASGASAEVHARGRAESVSPDLTDPMSGQEPRTAAPTTGARGEGQGTKSQGGRTPKEAAGRIGRPASSASAHGASTSEDGSREGEGATPDASQDQDELGLAENRPIDMASLTSSLMWSLTQKGLSWADLEDIAPAAAKKWRAWQSAAPPPAPGEGLSTFQTLFSAVEDARIDFSRLTRKMRRVKDLWAKRSGNHARPGQSLPAEDPSSVALGARVADAERRLKRQMSATDRSRLAVELTLLETELWASGSDGLPPSSQASAGILPPTTSAEAPGSGEQPKATGGSGVPSTPSEESAPTVPQDTPGSSAVLPEGKAARTATSAG